MFCDRGGAVVESRKRGMKMQDRYLFKAKRKDNCEWVQGYYVKGLNVLTNCEETHIIFEPNTIFYSSGETDGWYRVDPSTICRCTELKDKNGNLIWENDIIKAWSQGTCAKGKIKQRIDGTWIMYPAWQKGEMWYLCPDNNGETTVAVIGNIFDNPELLEV